ncbi:hypothetical protein CC78DRAFT_583066 [Lojkania enalia]|uniref:Uncharacterized protein n=1 Tax=Lojkania enalia TaxID=147567 RepID=A0A9P4K5L4_9PLEO|nr:hypothetical protein CC78DRAFT_583066 [Didymosphaeria enalia]
MACQASCQHGSRQRIGSVYICMFPTKQAHVPHLEAHTANVVAIGPSRVRTAAYTNWKHLEELVGVDMNQRGQKSGCIKYSIGKVPPLMTALLPYLQQPCHQESREKSETLMKSVRSAELRQDSPRYARLVTFPARSRTKKMVFQNREHASLTAWCHPVKKGGDFDRFLTARMFKGLYALLAVGSRNLA